MNKIKLTCEELDNMRCTIFGHRLQLLGEDVDIVDYFNEVLQIRTELLETPDEQIIKDYKKLLN